MNFSHSASASHSDIEKDLPAQFVVGTNAYQGSGENMRLCVLTCLSIEGPQESYASQFMRCGDIDLVHSPRKALDE